MNFFGLVLPGTYEVVLCVASWMGRDVLACVVFGESVESRNDDAC